jgi:aldehyde dehydrogenase (NAD+)
VRAIFASGRTLNEEFRLHNLKQLLRLYEENFELLLEALKEDMGKPRHEVICFEIGYIINDLKSTIKKLHKWMSPFKVCKDHNCF